MPTKTAHQILGISTNASAEQIKAAYRKAARRWHPDLHPDKKTAQKRMAEINGAYAELTKPKRRQRPSVTTHVRNTTVRVEVPNNMAREQIRAGANVLDAIFGTGGRFRKLFDTVADEIEKNQ